MNANKFMHLPIGIGSRDHADNRIQQHRRQIEALAFGTATILDSAKYFQQRQRHPTTSDSGCRR
jgi:hypothetical protein